MKTKLNNFNHQFQFLCRNGSIVSFVKKKMISFCFNFELFGLII